MRWAKAGGGLVGEESVLGTGDVLGSQRPCSPPVGRRRAATVRASRSRPRRRRSSTATSQTHVSGGRRWRSWRRGDVVEPHVTGATSGVVRQEGPRMGSESFHVFPAAAEVDRPAPGAVWAYVDIDGARCRREPAAPSRATHEAPSPRGRRGSRGPRRCTPPFRDTRSRTWLCLARPPRSQPAHRWPRRPPRSIPPQRPDLFHRNPRFTDHPNPGTALNRTKPNVSRGAPTACGNTVATIGNARRTQRSEAAP
jgi:hypothetical protein